MKINYIKPWRLIQLVAILGVLPILATGCTCNSADETQPEPYFPVQKEAQYWNLGVLLQGSLVIDKGYLRIYDALIIWPYGYSIKTEGKEMWIINDKGQTVARVGDVVKLSGGFMDASVAEERIGHALPEDAEGPYFLVDQQ